MYKKITTIEEYSDAAQFQLLQIMVKDIIFF